MHANPTPPASRYAFFAFFVTLFLFFTPFEFGAVHASFPRYLTVLISTALLLPLVAIKRLALSVPSVLVLISLAAILFHGVAVIAIPLQFIFLILANLLLAILVYEASFGWRKQFVAAVCTLLLINAVVIGMQALLFYTFSSGIYDFHKLLFGSDSRFAEDFLNIARFSGMQVEPGTYANYIACLLAILLLSCEFTEKTMWIAFVAIISIFVTNSGSSMYFVPVVSLLVAYLWRSKIRLYHVVLLLAAMALYLYFSGVLEHLENRFLEHDDGSLSHRMDGVHTYMLMSLEEKFIGVGLDQDPCVRCFYQDIGVTFNLLSRGGVIVALALALVVFRMVSANGVVLSAIVFLIPLNEKMFFYEAPVWILMLFAMTAVRSARRRAPSLAQPGPRLAGF